MKIHQINIYHCVKESAVHQPLIKGFNLLLK